MSGAARFFVLRHGQTDWNLDLRLQGSTDIPLNEAGREQARQAARRLAGRGVTRIIASPLVRALETARIAGATLDLEPDIDRRLIERGFGRFEGMTMDEVHRHREEMRAFMNLKADLDGRHYPDDAEPLTAVFDRIAASLGDHLAAEGAPLFVLHGIPFRAITRQVLGEMYSSPNAAPVMFEADGAAWRMTPLDPDNAPIRQSDNPTTTMGRL